jgi:hypothetical protein
MSDAGPRMPTSGKKLRHLLRLAGMVADLDARNHST